MIASLIQLISKGANLISGREVMPSGLTLLLIMTQVSFLETRKENASLPRIAPSSKLWPDRDNLLAEKPMWSRKLSPTKMNTKLLKASNNGARHPVRKHRVIPAHLVRNERHSRGNLAIKHVRIGMSLRKTSIGRGVERRSGGRIKERLRRNE